MIAYDLDLLSDVVISYSVDVVIVIAAVFGFDETVTGENICSPFQSNVANDMFWVVAVDATTESGLNNARKRFIPYGSTKYISLSLVIWWPEVTELFASHHLQSTLVTTLLQHKGKYVRPRPESLMTDSGFIKIYCPAA